MISPAPTIYPSGTRPVAAAGAGVQFATDPRLTSWDEDAGFAAREDDADRTGTSPGRVGGIRFQQVPAGAGVTGMKVGAC